MIQNNILFSAASFRENALIAKCHRAEACEPDGVASKILSQVVL